MKRSVILDTGPLVALINHRDRYHEWARLQWAGIEPPLLTCESVLSEACFLLRISHRGQRAVFELLERGVITIHFKLIENTDEVSRLLTKYHDIGISLADACLVRMSELHSESTVLTLDRDFKIYRKSNRQVIPLLSPIRG